MRKSTRTRRPAHDPHEGAGRRLAPRVPVQADCTVHFGDVQVDGVLLDISTGGAAIEFLDATPLAAGDVFSLEVPTVLSVIYVEATVVSQDEEVFGTYVLRVKFAEIAPALRTLIEQRAASFRERQAEIFLGRV